MSLSISRQKVKKIGLILGPILFFVILLLPISGGDSINSNNIRGSNNNVTDSTNINESNSDNDNSTESGLSFSAKLVLATTLWMAVWWITEAIPIYVTALLPLILFPSLSLTELGQTAANYADRIIFLFLGGFILAKAVEKTQLHKRFAFNILNIFGTTPKYIVAGFMLVTGLLSAWMSNTATTMLMLPIAAAVISQIGIGNKTGKNGINYIKNKNIENESNDKNIDNDEDNGDKSDRSRFGLCLMLSIAYSASIGGMATLIGTPPNAIFVSLSKSMLDLDISFGEWLLIGLPISGISLIVAWIYMVNIGVKITHIKSINKGKEVIREKLTELGKITADEKIVAGVFAATAIAWITRGLFWGEFLPMVDDSTIAITAAFLLFLIPSKQKQQHESPSTSTSHLPSLSAISAVFFPKKQKKAGEGKTNGNNIDNKKQVKKDGDHKIKHETDYIDEKKKDSEKDKTTTNKKEKAQPNDDHYDHDTDDEENENRKIMDWKSAVTIPWGVLLLIGGGLALADAFTTTGLDEWISNQLLFVENLNYILIVLVIVGVAVLASEIISNTATAALLIPITISLASFISIDPLLLMIPLTIATSYGFVMPVGTPPNAIVFGSKYVTAPKMARAGFPLDIIGIVMVTLLTTLMVPLIWGG